MTLRIAVIGNSHLAALRDGWVDHPGRWPGIDAQFVGAHKGLLLETAVTADRITPLSDAALGAFRRLGGVDHIDLAGVDAIVIAGCLVGVHAATYAYRDMRWDGLPSVAAAPDIAAMRPRFVSRAAARATLAARLSDRLGIQLIRHLRAATDLPILLTSQPRVSAVIKAIPRPETRGHADALAAGDAAGLSALFEEAAAEAAARAGGTFVPQPAQTIEDHILTARAYMDGARRLSAKPGLPQPKDDIMHANAAFGAAMLDAVAALLQPA